MDLFRHRSKGEFKPSPQASYRTRFLDCSSTSWVNSVIDSGILVGVVETMDDVVTPNWKSRRAKGEIVFNPMKSSRYESRIVDGGHGAYFKSATESCAATHTHFEVDHEDNFFATYFNGNFPLSPIPIPVREVISSKEISDLVTEVSTACLSKRGTADNNLFESVAEYKELVAMLRKPQNSLFKFIRKNGQKARRLSPENAWLAYRYGVKPFIKDVQGIISGLQKTVGTKRVVTRTNGEIQRSEIVTLPFTRNPVSVTVEIQTVDQVTVRAMSLDEYVATAVSNIGFASKGLLTLPWELIPYSFVADWFVNVGDFINAVAPSAEFTQLGSAVTVRRSQYSLYRPQSTSIVYTSGYLDPPIREVSGECYAIKTTKTRSKLGLPGLVIKHDFGLSKLTRQADALALLKQQLDRLFKA